MAWTEAASLDAIGENGVLGVNVEGTPIALYRLDGSVFATHNICTHAFAYLSEGWVEDGTIECPIHQGKFDIRTGQALCAPVTKGIKTYAVKVEDGRVFVDLAGSAAAAGSESAPALAATAALARVVIVGAGQASAAAIRALRTAGFAGTIDLVGDELHLPYERPPLSKELLLGKSDASAARCLTEADVETFAVRLHLGRRATSIDTEERLVALDDGHKLGFDALLLAVGGQARRIAIPGADLPGVLYLRTLDDAAALDRTLATAKRVAIVGGGFIGLELASSSAARGVGAVVLEREPELMARVLPAPLGRAFRKLAERNGVDVRTATAVQAIRKAASGLAVVTPAGEVQADAVIVGVGLEPETALAASAGCLVEGGVVVDDEGRTSVPGIWAAGDCALHHLPIRGRRQRLESWQNAEEQGAAAGRSIAGAAAEARKTPWFWTDQFGVNVQMLGTPGPDDSVALVGDDATPGAVYRTLDPATHRLTGVIAFSNAGAIRAGRTELENAAPFDAGGGGRGHAPDRREPGCNGGAANDSRLRTFDRQELHLAS